jgi:hypothetical protein
MSMFHGFSYFGNNPYILLKWPRLDIKWQCHYHQRVLSSRGCFKHRVMIICQCSCKICIGKINLFMIDTYNVKTSMRDL